MKNHWPSQEDLSSPLLQQQSTKADNSMPRQKLSPKSDDDDSSASGKIIKLKVYILCS